MSQAGPVVFVLDDDVRFVTALSSLLRCNGFTNRTFTSVDDFLKDHDLDCPGCLILDVRMPGMTGPGLQRELRSESADLPIIFIMAYQNPDVRAQVFEAGAVAFLHKPFYEEDLLDAINAALE